jgi:cytochrome c553
MKYILLLLWVCFALANTPEKAAVCAACHGQKGHAMQSNIPNIDAQSANYIIEQLKAYKDGSRLSAIMQIYANLLTDEEMRSLANYYANQPFVKNIKKTKGPAATLYQRGDYKKHLPACSACHGPEGLGHHAAKFPRLAQQHADYTKAQLKAFKEGTRPNPIMQTISKRLSQEDIERLSEYLETL